MHFDQLRRREFITLLGGAASWPRAAGAQQGERVRRIGVLMNMPADDPEGPQRAKALETGLQELGWIHGRNLEIVYRWVSHDTNLRTQAFELIAAQPDLILGSTTPALTALQQETRTIPIYNRPGGNATNERSAPAREKDNPKVIGTARLFFRLVLSGGLFAIFPA